MSSAVHQDETQAALATMAAFHRASSRHSWSGPETPHLGCARVEVALDTAPLPETRLSHCIEARLSCRRFDTANSPALAEFSQLLHLSYGQLGAVRTMQQVLDTRPVPSASGLYPLELCVFARAVEGLPPAIYRYDSTRHSLGTVAALPPPESLQQIFLQQDWVAEAPAVIVMAGRPDAGAHRYHARAYRFLLLECGHLGQNMMLGAQALGLASCPVGGFEDYRLCCAAGLAADEWPLYAMAVGRPDPAHDADLRTPEAYPSP